MGTIVKTLVISAAKKAVKIDPQDFITQDNVTTVIKLAGHVIKLIF
jgi:hypothetical protein